MLKLYYINADGCYLFSISLQKKKIHIEMMYMYNCKNSTLEIMGLQSIYKNQA